MGKHANLPADKQAYKDTVTRYVAYRIREAREIEGISMRELGGRIGLRLQSVQRYETGATEVTTARLCQIAKALGLPVIWFLPGGEAKASQPALPCDSASPSYPGDAHTRQ